MKVKKFDNDKPQFSDVPQKALLNVTKAFNYGANKYGKFNYSGKIEATRLYDACQRHLHSWITNKNIDESGNTHLSHAIASLLMLEEGFINNTVIDNRNKIYDNKKSSKVVKSRHKRSSGSNKKASKKA